MIVGVEISFKKRGVHVCMLLCKSKRTADFEWTWKGDVKLKETVYV